MSWRLFHVWLVQALDNFCGPGTSSSPQQLKAPTYQQSSTAPFWIQRLVFIYTTYSYPFTHSTLACALDCSGTFSLPWMRVPFCPLFITENLTFDFEQNASHVYSWPQWHTPIHAQEGPRWRNHQVRTPCQILTRRQILPVCQRAVVYTQGDVLGVFGRFVVTRRNIEFKECTANTLWLF